VRPDCDAVDDHPSQVAGFQSFEDSLPEPMGVKAVEQLPDRVQVAEPLGQFAPRGSDPDDGVERRL
jgi:hypothetical protein